MITKENEILYKISIKASSNSYLIKSDSVILIDPGHNMAFTRLLQLLKEIDISPEDINFVISTHSHGDHVGSVTRLKGLNPDIKIIASELMPEYQRRRAEIKLLEGAEDNFDLFEADISVKDGDILTAGSVNLRFIHTPGHTIDSIAVIIDQINSVFSGDSFYKGIMTQIDYYQGIEKSVNQITDTYKKLMDIDDRFTFYPGHGDKIDEHKKVISDCSKKLERLKHNPEMLIINNLVPSAEFYIYKNPGLRKEEIVDFFFKNMQILLSDPFVKAVDPEKFRSLMERLIALMHIIKMIKIEDDGKIYLSGEINTNL